MTTHVTIENPQGNGFDCILQEVHPEADGVARTYETVIPPGSNTTLSVWPQKKVIIFERPIVKEISFD